MADAEATSSGPPVSQYSSDKAVKRWFPLESNPEVMNSYSKKLGLPMDKYQWVDVLSTEEWVRYLAWWVFSFDTPSVCRL